MDTFVDKLKYIDHMINTLIHVILIKLCIQYSQVLSQIKFI